jgi:hypothetical protein
MRTMGSGGEKDRKTHFMIPRQKMGAKTPRKSFKTFKF